MKINTLELFEKLDRLDRQFAENGENDDPDSRELLRNWRKTVEEKIRKSDYIEHPITKEIAKQLKDRIIAINNRLCTERDLSPQLRDRLFAEKEVTEYYLSMISSNFEQEIRGVMDEVNINFRDDVAGKDSFV